jgi:hypothetical protein
MNEIQRARRNAHLAANANNPKALAELYEAEKRHSDASWARTRAQNEEKNRLPSPDPSCVGRGIVALQALKEFDYGE